MHRSYAHVVVAPAASPVPLATPAPPTLSTTPTTPPKFCNSGNGGGSSGSVGVGDSGSVGVGDSGGRARVHARVYYDTAWVAGQSVPRLLSRVPAIHGSRGGVKAPVSLQDGTTCCEADLTSAHDLLAPDERIRGRKLVMIGEVTVSATGGCGGLPRTVQDVPRTVLAVHARTSQMDHPLLEPRLFIAEPGDERIALDARRAATTARAPTFVRLDNGSWFDQGAYRACIADDIRLILAALELHIHGAETSRVLLKLPALGLGGLVSLADGTLVGPRMFSPFLRGLCDALGERARPWLAAIEVPDPYSTGALLPRVPVPVPVVSSVRDLLDFSPDEHAEFVCAVIVPGTAFCLPGGQQCCLETAVAQNTNLCSILSCTENPSLLDATRHVAVSLPRRLTWWPPAAWRLETTRMASHIHVMPSSPPTELVSAPASAPISTRFHPHSDDSSCKTRRGRRGSDGQHTWAK